MKQDSPLSDIRIGQVTHQWASAQKIKSFHFQKIESTNLKAKEEAFSETSLSEQLVLYVAEAQTQGKGRGQNTWNSAFSGSQLLSTWSFMVDAITLPTTSPLIGLALYKAANATWPFLNFSLKAPNDLFINDKKVAGLLIETISQGDDIRLIIGLGLNVIHFPEELTTATSIVASMTNETPLLAEDWISFLERWLFEVSIAIQLSYEPLNTTTIASLKKILNLNPLLKEKITDIKDNGTLIFNDKKILWSDL